MQKRFKKKWVKPAIISGISLVVVAGCIVGYTVYAKSGSPTTTTRFVMATANKGSISTSISGSGTVSSSGEYALTSSNAGTVDTLNVKQGDTVTAGEIIAHITATSDQQSLTQKQNALTTANNNLAQAEQNLTNGSTIKAPVAGRVKEISASAGDDLSVTKAAGNLMVISADGKMDLSVSASLPLGATVSVNTSDSAGAAVTVSGTVTAGGSGSAGSSGQGSNGSYSQTTIQINEDDLPVGANATVSYNGQTYAAGKLSLDSSVAISNPGSGTISKVNVSENQVVAKGAALVTLNSASLQSAVDSAKTAVTNAQNDVANAQSQLDKATITSPVNGVVATVSTAAGSTVQSGGAIVTILDPTKMQTVVTVDETDIAKVSVGQKASITVSAVSGKTFSGSVTAVDVMGTSSNGVTNFNVTVSIDNPDGVRVGETANANIITQEKDSTIVVPAAAVVEKRGTTGYVLPADQLFDSNGKSLVLNDVSTQELVRKYGKQVTLGLSTSNQVEIVSGVSSGEKLAEPITINNAAVKTLSGSNSSSSSLFGMGGYGAMGGGYGNFGGGTTTRRSGGTGNTVSGSTGTTTGNTGGSASGRG